MTPVDWSMRIGLRAGRCLKSTRGLVAALLVVRDLIVGLLGGVGSVGFAAPTLCWAWCELIPGTIILGLFETKFGLVAMSRFGTVFAFPTLPRENVPPLQEHCANAQQVHSYALQSPEVELLVFVVVVGDFPGVRETVSIAGENLGESATVPFC